MALMHSICILLLFHVVYGNDSLDLTHGVKWDVSCNNKNISLSVNIPKTVHMALLEASYIKDPYVGMRDKQYAWIADEDWTYQTIFYVQKEMLDYPMARLIFDGLDTVSKVLLNGFVIGKSDNMFVKYTFNISKYIKLRNVLQVQFVSPTKYSARKSKQYYENFGYNVPPLTNPPEFHGRNHPNFIRKEQCSFSWDWGPSFPTIGIWKGVSVEFSDFAYLDDIMIRTEYNREMKTWTVHYEAVIQVFNASKVIVTFGFSSFFEKKEVSFDDDSSIRKSLGFIVIPESSIQRWWPHGYGKQKIYKASVYLTNVETFSVISKEVRFGFRSVELVQKPVQDSNGLSFYFKINSVPMFLKGANWIPVDSFQERVTPSVLRDLFESSIEANFNALRVWGGGIYEQERFYELADEMGLLIWQDLMFAVALYPVNSKFIKSVEMEIMSQIRRLQHHPSIIAWSGNNENEAAIAQTWWKEVVKNKDRLVDDYKKLYMDTIQPIVMAEDKTRPFVVSSPSNGDFRKIGEVVAKNPQSPLAGDVHYYNYVDNCWDPSIFPKPRFASEYGYQSYPSLITLSKIASGNELTWGSLLMEYRQHHPNGNVEIEKFIKQHFDLPLTNNTQKYFHYMIYLSQIVQATCVKYETEHYRRLQGRIEKGEGFTMGALYWQLNDIWQGPSWSSLEYGGRWKMLHYYVKELFQPIAVNGFVKNDTLHAFVVNEYPEMNLNLQLDINVYNFDGFNALWSRSVRTTSQEKYSFEVHTENVMDMCPDKLCFCKLKLIDASNGFILSQSDVFLSSLSSMTIKDPKLFVLYVTAVNKYNFKIILQAESPAAFVWLETELSGRFSKNGFNMVGEVIEILFHTKAVVSALQLQETLKVISLYDVYKL